MAPAIQTILIQWLSREATAALWLAAASLLLFGASLFQAQEPGSRAWDWLRRVIEAFFKALAFAALVGMLSFLLSNSYLAFNKIYASFTTGGSLSNRAWQAWRQVYGDVLEQQDLVVTQSIQVPGPAPLPTVTPSGPVLYLNAPVAQPIQQNSITGFRGRVIMNGVDPQHPDDIFNGLVVSARYEYEITNPSNQETQAEFRFPLHQAADGSGTKFYQDIWVMANGQEVNDWQMVDGAIRWVETLQPRQPETLSIQYVAYGTNGFLFEIPEPREITDFQLTIALDVKNCGLRTEPENGGIQLDAQSVPPYQIMTWTIDRAILAPRLGVDIHQKWPYAPYHEMIVTLALAARAVILCLALVTITLLIFEIPVHLRLIAMLGALFLVPFFVLESGAVPAPRSIAPAQFALAQVCALPVLGLLPLALAFFILRGLARFPQALVLILLALFMGGYVWIGLLPDEQKHNAAEGMVQAGMIAYTFLLALFVRVRGVVQAQRKERAIHAE